MNYEFSTPTALTNPGSILFSTPDMQDESKLNLCSGASTRSLLLQKDIDGERYNLQVARQNLERERRVRVALEQHSSSLLGELHQMKRDYQNEIKVMDEHYNELTNKVVLLSRQNTRLENKLRAQEDHYNNQVNTQADAMRIESQLRIAAEQRVNEVIQHELDTVARMQVEYDQAHGRHNEAYALLQEDNNKMQRQMHLLREEVAHTALSNEIYKADHVDLIHHMKTKEMDIIEGRIKSTQANHHDLQKLNRLDNIISKRMDGAKR